MMTAFLRSIMLSNRPRITAFSRDRRREPPMNITLMTSSVTVTTSDRGHLFPWQFLGLLDQSSGIPVREQGSTLLRVVARAGVILAQESDRVSPAEGFCEGTESTISQFTLVGDQCFHWEISSMK